MITFKADNCNYMAPMVYDALLEEGTTQDSRNGKVLAFDEPCSFEYTRPDEMVYLCPIRDCNPFFHVMEGVAMVAGLNSVEFLSWFNSNMRLYSDDGETYNAFYGTRMGSQFNKVISLLHKDPGTRQAVIQLWDHNDLLKKTKDKACNMSMVFRRVGHSIDMTVFCRSNDLIYGGVTGANIVHFPFIHAVLCYELNCIQGSFTHVVNNAHVYVDNPHFGHMDKFTVVDSRDMFAVPIDTDKIGVAYFCTVANQFPEKIKYMAGAGDYINGVLIPMYNAFSRHKRSQDGLSLCYKIKDEAWHMAARAWLLKREAK